MDIPVNAAKPGRRRYLTLVMIFITVGHGERLRYAQNLEKARYGYSR